MLPTPCFAPFVKDEPDIAYKEQFTSPKDPLLNTKIFQTQLPTSTSSESKNQNGKRPLEKNEQRKRKKQKLAKRPVYTEGCQPAMILNEYYKNLQFTFQNENSIQTKFICSVSIDVNDPTTGHTFKRQFTGSGLSKKNAKKECCNQVLNALFPDSYHGPEKIYHEKEIKEELADLNTSSLKRLTEMRRRISKLVTLQTIQIKSPSQILHELSSKIADNGIFLEENTNFLDKKFCFQIHNIQNESLISPNSTDPLTIIACGYGKLIYFQNLLIIVKENK